MRLHVTVNGKASELLMEQEALTWWRSTGHQQQDGSPIRQLVRRLSNASLNQQQDKNESQVTANPTLESDCGALPAITNNRKRIEFNRMIGIERVGKGQHKNESKHDSVTSSKEATSASSQQQATPAQRLKVYFASKNDNSQSGRLQKLKKITIELKHHDHHSSTVTSTSHNQSNNVDLLHHKTACQLDHLYDQIEQQLELRRRQRPRKLLIFVNPFGGKGKAVHLFEKKVKRVLDLARIDSDLVITKFANHARETLQDVNTDLDQYDGIVCIGGDGMFAELMNGLLFRVNQDKLIARRNMRTKVAESRLNLSSDLESIENSASSSTSSSGSSSSTTTTASSDDKSDKKDGPRERNNNIEHDDEGIGKEVGEKVTPRDVTFRQQMDFLRSSLGGIGERFYTPTIPIGIIGAGSTDANLFGFIGTNDVISATLNIVLGNQIQIDVCSIHSISDDRLLRFVSTFVAYGYFGDVVRESEKLRWLGPSRYDVTALNSLIKYRNYDGLVRILSSPRDGSPRDLNRCHLDCRLCCNNISSSSSFSDFLHNNNNNKNDSLSDGLKIRPLDDLEQYEIVEKRGSFVGVNAAVTACRCPQTRKGFSPGNHLANGCADLILVRPCSRMQYINYLIRTGYTRKSAFDLKYVEAYRCRQFEFIVDQPQGGDGGCDSVSGTDDQSTTSGYGGSTTSTYKAHSNDQLKQQQQQENRMNSSWNADGEILKEQSIRVKVNNKLLRVFGTGEPRQRRQKPKLKGAKVQSLAQ